MTRSAQNLLLVLVGGAVLWITLASGEYVNYVKPGFRYLLVPAGGALVLLGMAGLRREWRDTGNSMVHEGVAQERRGGLDDHSGHPTGHDHSHGPRVAWLLCLPVLAIFVIAPPALGSFTASRDAGRPAPPPAPPAQGFGALPRGGAPIPMTMGEFIGRSYEAQTGAPASLAGVPVRLTGFVTPRKNGGWQVTRLKMACCAGDAIPFPVIVRGLPQPPADAWVQVDGTWAAPAPGRSATGVHELLGSAVRRVAKPRNPYE
ncbi:TIGR03943 family putative permease subunit [Actinomadura macra]|uniref:TIGR03943 family putative permease subunit n=1 Tax=Actinomadura macra TaxID=46164 RepID=UPI000831A1C3|nr:TIGR03943 family protein [Actinomadura macra]